jgi:hypothetical protein
MFVIDFYDIKNNDRQWGHLPGRLYDKKAAEALSSFAIHLAEFKVKPKRSPHRERRLS